MNVDRILETMNRLAVEYLLVGGVNYLLRHEPVLTYDVDLWIRNTGDNLRRCETALGELDAAWGESEAAWGSVASRETGWLGRQNVYCLTSPYGSIDIFLAVKGLGSWEKSARRAFAGETAADVAYRGLCDADMLASQLALDVSERKADRIRRLREAEGTDDERPDQAI